MTIHGNIIQLPQRHYRRAGGFDQIRQRSWVDALLGHEQQLDAHGNKKRGLAL
jgi:hypothetical protein